MRYFIFISIVLAPFFNLAQDLSKKIAADANLMLRLNGAKTLLSVSEEEFEQSKLFELLMKEFFRSEEEISELSEFGIDFYEPIYIVNELTEDVSIFYLAFKIKNLGTFENLAKTMKAGTKVIEENSLKCIKYNEESSIYWNDKYALFITGDYIGYDYSYYGGYEWGEAKSEEKASQVEIIEETEAPAKELTEEEYQEQLREQERRRKEEEKARKKRREEKERKREEKRQKRQEIISKTVQNRADLFFSDQKENKNTYLRFEYNNNADAQFWYANNILNYRRSFGRRTNNYRRPIIPMFGLGYFFGLGNSFNGDFSSALFLDEELVRLESSIHYPENLFDAYKDILSEKIDRQFLKLISDEDLGYFSFSSSTEELLNHYPDIIQQTYSYFDSTHQEEYQYFADLFNIIIDEERISEVLTGDIVFVMNDLTEQEVEYITYDYDENYESKKIKKTRTEFLPEFSILVGCEDETLVDQSIELGIKNGWLITNGNGYQLIDEDKEFPFELFFAYNNDIIITSTSRDRMERYFDGKLSNKVSGDKKKIVKSNSGGMFLNLHQLFNKLLMSDIRGDERRILTEVQDDVTEMFAEMNYKNGKAHINTHAIVPETYNNGAHYLLNVINDLAKEAN